MHGLPRRSLALSLGAAALLAGAAPAMAAGDPPASRLFVSSAVEQPGDVAQLPAYRATSQGGTVWFTVLDASRSGAASSYGVNRSNKLANAAGTAAVQRVTVGADGTIDFPASVDFAPARTVVPGPTGFPPDLATPGAVGEPGYSPLIELPDGTVLNAPQIANATGRADKVVALDTGAGTVLYRETNGESRGHHVRYLSFDASDPLAAALENATYAPALNAAPTLDDDSTASARTSLGAIVNGATGAANPERQGLNSALLDGLDPLNILRWLPQQGRYSPLWDVHAAAWAGDPTRIDDWDRLTGLVGQGALTGPGGTRFGAAGFIVNCPIVALVTGG